MEPAAARITDSLCALLTNLGDDPAAALAAIPELYDEDIYFEDCLTRLRGRDRFVRMNEQLIGLARELRVDVHARATGGDSLFIAWTFHYRPRIGPLLVVPGVTHARIRGERVVDHRDYWDPSGPVLAALPLLRRLRSLVLDRMA
jgi:hypothetical protein